MKSLFPVNVLLTDLQTAQLLVHSYGPPTPCNLIRLGEREIWLKREDLSDLGAYKWRGAAVCLARASANSSDFIVASTGNFGLGMATIGRRLGKRIRVVVPTSTPTAKRLLLLSAGAVVSEGGSTLDEASAYARAVADERGWHVIEQTDSNVMLGFASVAVEFFGAAKGVGCVFLPLGAGVTAAAWCLARKLLRVDVDIIGVVPTQCPAWLESWRHGRALSAAPLPTSADALRTMMPNSDVFDYLRRNLTTIIGVSEEEIERANQTAMHSWGVRLEGASSAALAAALSSEGVARLRDCRPALVACR